MKEMKTKMIELLKAYPIEKKKLALLRNELSHFVEVTPEEMLEAMMFSKSEDGTRPTAGSASDKTARIAMSYRQKAADANQDAINDILAQIWELERKVDRMDHCLAQLKPEQAAILRGLYFDRRQKLDLAEELFLSERTVCRYRDRAIDELIEMYLTLQQAGITLDW